MFCFVLFLFHFLRKREVTTEHPLIPPETVASSYTPIDWVELNEEEFRTAHCCLVESVWWSKVSCVSQPVRDGLLEAAELTYLH